MDKFERFRLSCDRRDDDVITDEARQSAAVDDWPMEPLDMTGAGAGKAEATDEMGALENWKRNKERFKRLTNVELCFKCS